MEEDIKLVEKMIKEYKQFGDLDNPEFEDTDRIYKAIENLLKRYKELEEYYEEQNEVNAKFIPISVIKNKIDELKKEYDDFLEWDREDDAQITSEIIGILEELLEERNK